MSRYDEKFPVGTRVVVAAREELEEFRTAWTHHNPLLKELIDYAGQATKVKAVSFYHGGDALYELEGIPGVWHEICLRPA